jgi:CheY-like chemotaxis protein
LTIGPPSDLGVDRRSARPSRPLRVLLVEDSLVNRKLASAVLKKQGHTVTVAGDGREAVEAVANRSSTSC